MTNENEPSILKVYSWWKYALENPSHHGHIAHGMLSALDLTIEDSVLSCILLFILPAH